MPLLPHACLYADAPLFLPPAMLLPLSFGDYVTEHEYHANIRWRYSLIPAMFISLMPMLIFFDADADAFSLRPFRFSILRLIIIMLYDFISLPLISLSRAMLPPGVADGHAFTCAPRYARAAYFRAQLLCAARRAYVYFADAAAAIAAASLLRDYVAACSIEFHAQGICLYEFYARHRCRCRHAA